MIAKSRAIEVKKIIHDDKWVVADVIDVALDNGKTIRNFLRVTTKNGGYVGVIPRLTDGRFILVRQCKPVAGLSIEFVAGARNEGEAWERAAVREMIEETGYEPGRMQYVGRFYTQTDRVDNPCHLFLAFDCRISEQKLAGDEIQGIEHLIVSPEEAMRLIRSGEIKDASTLAGILAHLLLDGGGIF